MVYHYLYQDKENHNCEGDIKARDRQDAYQQLRKQGIRPYRVIGDDPWNWRPWAIAAGYVVLLVAIVALSVTVAVLKSEQRTVNSPKMVLKGNEAEEFRARAESVVNRAPEIYRYDVWKGVNARLAERGLEPLPMPEGMVEP